MNNRLYKGFFFILMISCTLSSLQGQTIFVSPRGDDKNPGTKEKPVRFVNIKGFVFRHAARTFMDNKEPLLRSDWTVYRGGAAVFNGAEDCSISDCEFDQVGGNTIFVNNYNRRITIRGCYIHNSGDVFKNNIVFKEYQPAIMDNAIAPDGKWGKELDYNFYVAGKEIMLQFSKNGCDNHSINGDPLFINTAKGDFRVKEGSPAFKLGFVNFPMDQFGVTKPSLKAIAKTPEIPIGY